MSLDMDVSLALSGVFYLCIGLWWHVQVTKKYWSTSSSKEEFKTSLTYPCCQRWSHVPVEGGIKFVASLTICAVTIFQIYHNPTDPLGWSVGQITVFVIFTLSGICDILSQSCPKFIFTNFDHLLLIIAFNTQSIVLSYHTDSNMDWSAVADSCAMLAGTAAAIATLLEFKYKQLVWLPLMRGYCTVVMGTWFLHMVLVSTYTLNTSILNLSHQNVTMETVVKDTTTNLAAVSVNASYTVDGLSVKMLNLSRQFLSPNILYSDLVPMYFTWHCFVDMNILTILWMIVYKLTSKGMCPCVPEDEESRSHFENRVHFKYHMIDRMTDSDVE